MCGTPRGGGDDSEVIGHSDESNLTKLNVTDAVIAEMLARIAAAYISRPEVNHDNVEVHTKRMVESLLQFRT